MALTMNITMAFSEGRLVGAILNKHYNGAEYEHPHGFKHLLDANVQFDIANATFDPKMGQSIVDANAPGKMCLERKVAMRLTGINFEDLSTAERQIFGLLEKTGYLKRNDDDDLIEGGR